MRFLRPFGTSVEEPQPALDMLCSKLGRESVSLQVFTAGLLVCDMTSFGNPALSTTVRYSLCSNIFILHLFIQGQSVLQVCLCE